MRTILRFLFVISFSVVVLVVVQAEFRCDYIKIPNTRTWIKFHEVPSSWNEARLRCYMEGAVLASPQKEILKETMIKLTKYNNVTCAVFTGIHAIFSRGNYASIEGVPLSKIPHRWAKGEPNNDKDNGSSCLVMLPDGTIGDTECADLFPYFCYKEDTNDKVLNRCGTTDDEYQYDWRTGSCYKFHGMRRTWSRAYMTCMAEGGHLAIINSDTEANVTKELSEKNKITDNYVFIGFHDWTEHGDWKTIHGTTLKEAGYEKFGPSDPNNSTGGEFCGAAKNGYMLVDLYCEKMFPFICEMVPNSIPCYNGTI